MGYLILIAALAMPPSAVEARSNVAARNGKPCTPTATLVGAEPTKPGVRKLGEMPAAAQILTVYRTVDKCPEPVVLRWGIGR
jgi:hypothetical protein